MPPKVKVTKEDIVNSAFNIVRKNGAAALNARTIATTLGCSTQPVFSNFDSMQQLQLAVVARADRLCADYIRQEVESGKFPVYKASGMAYIRYAREEPELFKLLYMRNRRNEPDCAGPTLNDQMESVVQRNTGLKEAEVKLFHLEMWAFVHGIAVMAATDFINLDEDLVSRMLTDAYLGMRKQYGLE